MQCVSSFSRNGALQVLCRCRARGLRCLNHGDVCQLQSQEVRTGFVLFSRWLCQLRGASSPGTTSGTSVVPELLSLQSVTALVCLHACRALLQRGDSFVCFTHVFTTFTLTGNVQQPTWKQSLQSHQCSVRRNDNCFFLLILHWCMLHFMELHNHSNKWVWVCMWPDCSSQACRLGGA